MCAAMDLSMKKHANLNGPLCDYVDLTLEDAREPVTNKVNEDVIIELPDDNEEDTNDDGEWESDEMNRDDPDEHYLEQNYPNQPFHTHYATNQPYGIENFMRHLYDAENYRHNETVNDTIQSYQTNDDQDDDDQDEDFEEGNSELLCETVNEPDQPYHLEEEIGQPYQQGNNSFQYYYTGNGPPQDYVNESQQPIQGYPYEDYSQQPNAAFNPNPYYQPEGNTIPMFTNYDYHVRSVGGEITFSYCKIDLNDLRGGWGSWGPAPFGFGNNF